MTKFCLSLVYIASSLNLHGHIVPRWNDLLPDGDADIKQPVNGKKLCVIVRGRVLLFPTDREIVYSSAAISV